MCVSGSFYVFVCVLFDIWLFVLSVYVQCPVCNKKKISICIFAKVKIASVFVGVYSYMAHMIKLGMYEGVDVCVCICWSYLIEHTFEKSILYKYYDISHVTNGLSTVDNLKSGYMHNNN